MTDDEIRDVVAAVAYSPDKDKFLLVKRSSLRKRFPNEWEFPSGFLEDESEQEGALRELKEETGLVGEVIRTGESFEVETEMYHFRIHPVLVKVDFGDVDLTEEHEDFEWIEIEDIRKYNTVPQLRKDLEQVGVVDG
jgi:8-oxo-dGTP pyrophosphatase MutT (NUDIX family)